MVTHRFPSDKFTPCNIKRIEQMNKNYAYLIVIRMTNVKSKYWNNFISQSKCRHIRNGRYDNGRVMSADSLEITLTDVDLYLLNEAYDFEYEILECWYSIYRYLPKQFINFILDKYVLKTQYKGVAGQEIEYNRQKSLFNSLYGMTVTNTIRDEVTYDNETGWSETPISNEEIIKKLKDEEKEGFLSFSWGTWVTAYARSNLLKNAMLVDDYLIYCDTDSLKIRHGYNKEVIDNYNKFVENKIKHVSEVLQIPYERFAPKDIKGKERMLGVFDADGEYTEFITKGAKKYAYKVTIPKDTIKDIDKYRKDMEDYICYEDDDVFQELHITVSGVPKNEAKRLNGDLHNFKDNLVFEGKSTLFYCEDQVKATLVDDEGIEYEVSDKSGCCLVPNKYTLSTALEYASLLDDSSNRAIYKINM